MGVIVNMLCAVRWPAVINMELMLWTQIVVYFDNTFTFTRLRVCLTRMPPRHCPQLWHRSRRHRHRPRLRPLLRRRIFHNTVSISGLDPDSPHPQPWQSKIVTRNKVHRLYSQQLFYSARAGGLGCLVQDQISILYSLLGAKKWPHCAKLDIDAGVYSVRSVSWILWICEIYLYLCISCHSWLVSPRVYACNIGHRHLFSHKIT